jgi:hypothetical protein
LEALKFSNRHSDIVAIAAGGEAADETDVFLGDFQFKSN